MRVIIFSWEFPPRIVGELAEYVRELASQLVRNGVEAHVVTFHDYLLGAYSEPDGVRVYRVTNPVKTHIGVVTWVLTLNEEVERAASNIYYDNKRQIDLIDAHDWHFIPAAVTLKKGLGIPFVYNVESLEDHRSHGANAPFNMAIKSIEWLGMYEAEKLVVKSAWMKEEAVRIYKVPKEKVKVIQPKSAAWIKQILDVYKDSVEGQLPIVR